MSGMAVKIVDRKGLADCSVAKLYDKMKAVTFTLTPTKTTKTV